MTDTTRDLIQRLADALTNAIRVIHNEDGTQHISTATPVLIEARTYLAQPEPEDPTDEELVAVLKQAIKDFPPNHPDAKALDSLEYDIEIELRKARAVLTRWGRPAIEPIPVSERPWEREGWCDGDGWCWVWNAGNCQWWEWIDSALISFAQDDYTHSLPHYALPVPTTTQETP